MKKVLGKLLKTIAYTLIIMYVGIVLVEQQVKLSDFNEEAERYSRLIQEEKLKTEKLSKTKSELSSAGYIEEVAREKLGLVMPYEIVFIDANA